MSATYNWAQTYGSSGSETTSDLGASGNLFNFKDADDATAANYSSNPVVAGTNSYEVWLRAHFTGTFNEIDNLQFWMSTDFDPNTGLSVKYTADQESYVTPVKTESTIADTAVPTSDPGTANVTIDGELSGSLEEAGYSDYIVLQLQTTTSAASGDTSLAVFTCQYDES
jgi:hypothetical protein